ncbi:Protein CBG26437 [Caenorhabditis briggsae]|uniref:Protein CBG26437 n=1 Tax=Caenorhabditis briggsae TaxID=6238 RepID=B6IEX4_CAEBR|nr:Protein CBG26437 [Caenorhabditis briggsae]CAR98454.1 Protein CBG26437 [Caenorhabditis briggsae]
MSEDEENENAIQRD